MLKLENSVLDVPCLTTIEHYKKIININNHNNQYKRDHNS